jgi:hypothetical protein
MPSYFTLRGQLHWRTQNCHSISAVHILAGDELMVAALRLPLGAALGVELVLALALVVAVAASELSPDAFSTTLVPVLDASVLPCTHVMLC